MRFAARGTRLALLLGFLAPMPLAGQGVTVADVLQYPGSVRSIGLNGAGTAIVGDAGAVFANPAAIATIHHISLEVAGHRFPSSARLGSGALAWRLGQFDLGGGLQYLDVGGAGSATPSYVFRGVGTLVYRFGFIALGASGVMVRDHQGSTEGRGLSGDLGVAIPVFDIMALGFSVQNVSGNWDKTSTLVLPRTTRFGFTMNYTDPEETFRLLSTIEWVWPEGLDTRFVAGGEAGIVVHGVGLVGRLAYGSEGVQLGRATVTYGGSVHFGDMQVDYAYDPGRRIGDDGHHIGLRITL